MNEEDEEEFAELIEVLEADDVNGNDDVDGDSIDEMDESQDWMEEEGDGIQLEDKSYVTFAGHSDSVYCAAIHHSRPGLVLTGGGDDKAFLWQYASTVQENGNMAGCITSCIELTGHADTITSVGFNFDGTLALTGSYDGSVRIFQVDSGVCIMTLVGPEDVEWAKWHFRGNAVIAGSRDGTVWMWLTHNGQCVQVFAGHDGAVSCGNFTSDGKLICTGGEDGTVRLWLPKTGACKHVFQQQSAHETMVTSLCSSKDGDLLLSGGADGKMNLYQISGKRLLQSFLHATVSFDEIKPRSVSTTQATESSMKEAEEAELGESDLAASLSVECIGFSAPEFRWVASGGMDCTLKIWDMGAANSAACRCVCPHAAGSVVALHWHATLPVVITAALDNLIRVWDARNGSLLSNLPGHRDLVTSFEAAPLLQPELYQQNGDIDQIVSVSDDGTAKIYHLNVQTLLLP